MASGDKSGEGNLKRRERCDAAEFWSDIGADPDSLSPKGQAVAGAVTGGTVLLAVVLLVAFTNLWWLVFVFGWIVFPAIGMFARGVAGIADSGTSKPLEGDRERELLQALRGGGELSPAQGPMETSLTVLAGEGHLRVRVRGGGIFYSLWEVEPGEHGEREFIEN